jgi:hypothetical protein
MHNGVELKEFVSWILVKQSRTLALNEVGPIRTHVNLVERVAVPGENVGVQPNSIHSPAEAPGFCRRKYAFS